MTQELAEYLYYSLGQIRRKCPLIDTKEAANYDITWETWLYISTVQNQLLTNCRIIKVVT